ncbi:MAG: cobyrinic acid a c-diamide [Geobacteraceae bacterium]|nr:MAG: cobyrinic acid a c-diamide [Geobacteraceae bacterium]
MKSIIIAAPHSGSGKTTVALGIMECLKRHGLTVAPFKVGPDFIDPGYHGVVTGRTSINLDGWMCGAEFVEETFACHVQDADVAVIEGVMGLYDGIGGVSDEGSTAQVAKLLGASVILVVDAKCQARSAAALVKGFAEFDPQVRVVGVIFNNVGSDNHARILREAVEAAVAEVKVLGCLPRDERLNIPSRHLGLLTADENPLPETFLGHLAEAVEMHVDVDGIVNVGATPCGCPKPGRPRRAAPTENPVRIAVARDEAFCFVYEDNLRLLREAGASIVEFSPLRDAYLPADVAGIYLPGGYPEVFADILAANEGMKQSIREAIDNGMPAYAECGGFVYLTQGVVGAGLAPAQSGHPQGAPLHEMVGIFLVMTRMLPKRKALGYREVELTADAIIGSTGAVARGHEFHYSEMGAMPAHVERVYLVRKNGIDLGHEGYRYKNCLASYIHLHFGSCPGMAAAFVESCRKYKAKIKSMEHGKILTLFR